MTTQHTTRCFFGCNSGSGFHTFFNFLPRLDGARIIIVKGGPGTGKSTFISSIGDCFAHQGFDLEYQHCSLDPNSYDAVVIPQLKAVVTAATGHHVFDPKNPGAVDEILNLGDHWDVSRIRPHSREILLLNQESDRLFRKAFRILKAARQYLANVEDIRIAHQDPKELRQVADEIGVLFADARSGAEYGGERHAYISSNTPEGVIRNVATLARPTTRIVGVCGDMGSGRTKVLETLGEQVKLRGLDVEYYHRPIDPALLEHLYVPALDLLVTTQPEELSDRTIQSVFNLIGKNTDRLFALRHEITDDTEQYEELLEKAMQVLAQIKAAHGELEQYYIDSMDFDGVNERMQATVASLERLAA